MKIAFWSPYHGQAGTTSNILAIAILAGMVHKQKVVLTQTQFEMNNLEAPFVGVDLKNRDSSEYFRGIGIDTLNRSLMAAPLTKDDVMNCCIEFLDGRLQLLPGSSKHNRQHFEQSMSQTILTLLGHIEKHCDVVFLDISSGNNPISKMIIEESDLVVVNLSQNIGITDRHFSNPFEGAKGEKFYLIGSYDPDSKYNLSSIRRTYRKHMKQNNTGVVPYNTGFLDAQNDRDIINFFLNNINSAKDDINGYFIQEATQTAEKILALAKENKEKRQVEGGKLDG